MVLVQKWPFFQLCFFRKNISQANEFYDIPERKNGFLGYKNNRLKQSKNWHFSKGVNPWFWSKNGHFSNFVFSGNIGQANVFYDLVERKNAFLDYKTRRLTSQKIDIFPKGLIHGFGPKMAIFPTLFFQKKYKPGKWILRYPRTKKRLSRL